MGSRREGRNQWARERLERSLPPIFPPAVLVHAFAQPWTPHLPRVAIESYWRSHPIRADRLARSLAARSGAPEGWAWQGLQADEQSRTRTFRDPPAPYREAAFRLGPGHCCICGQPVFRFGWHRDLWQAGEPNRRAQWHAACVTAWKLWTAPGQHLKILGRLQRRRCALRGGRLLKTAEVDHRVPLYRVWQTQSDTAWPDLLRFWGFPNLQALNAPAHRGKSAIEAGSRALARVNHGGESRETQTLSNSPQAVV